MRGQNYSLRILFVYWHISDGEDFEPNEVTNQLDDKWDGEDEDDDVAVRFIFTFFKSLKIEKF